MQALTSVPGQYLIANHLSNIRTLKSVCTDVLVKILKNNGMNMQALGRLPARNLLYVSQPEIVVNTSVKNCYRFL